VISYSDPYVPSLALDGTKLTSVDLMTGVREAHVVVIVTDHSCYPYADIVAAARAVVDTRNATRGIRSDKVARL